MSRAPCFSKLAKHDKQSTGRRGEVLAASYLLGKGYQVIARNVFVGGGELDIVAEYKNTLRFVEVRTVGPDSVYSGLETITTRKRAQLAKSARAFIAKYGLGEYEEIFFDCMGVVLKTPPHFEWVPDAFIVEH